MYKLWHVLEWTKLDISTFEGINERILRKSPMFTLYISVVIIVYDESYIKNVLQITLKPGETFSKAFINMLFYVQLHTIFTTKP